MPQATSFTPSEEQVPYGYTKFSSTDVQGANIGQAPTKREANGINTVSIASAARACDATPGCVAFNSSGFLKSSSDETTSSHGDLYVKTVSGLDQKKAEFQRRHTELERYRTGELGVDINRVTSTFKTFVKAAGTDTTLLDRGISGESLADDTAKIEDRLSAYKTLNSDVSRALATLTNDRDIGGRLNNLGTIQTRISDLEAEYAAAKKDAATAAARAEVVHNPDQKVSYMQLYGTFNRPIKTGALPILIALTVLFFMVAVVGFYMFMSGTDAQDTAQNIFKNTRGILAKASGANILMAV